MSLMPLALSAMALTSAGLTGLSLAMDRHHRQLRPGHSMTPQHRQWIRWVGIALLTLSTVVCIAAWGLSIGLVAWLGMVTTSALLLICLLPYAPQWALHIALFGGICGLSLFLWVTVGGPLP